MPAHELTPPHPDPDHKHDRDDSGGDSSHESGWAQVHLEFADWSHAEHTAAHQLRPLLTAEAGISGWWFTRKHPCWRLRYQPTNDAAPRLADALDNLAATTALRHWTPTIYEPETHAFGGAAAMDIAHRLFHHDSRAILDHLHTPAPDLPGRRELTVLAVSLLLRGAELDWYEQGDVWARLSELRPLPPHQPPVAQRTLASLRRLMATPAGPESRLLAGGPLVSVTGWLTAFDQAGQELAHLAGHGELRRGLRATLAHHVIFHWNRLGLPYTTQSLLAHTATAVVMEH